MEMEMSLTLANEKIPYDTSRRLAAQPGNTGEIESVLGDETQKLRVGHSTYLPPQLLAMIHRIGFDDFHRIRIERFPELTPKIVQMVVAGMLDIGFGDLPICHPDLLSYPLYEEPVVVCMSAGNVMAAHSSIRPQDLKDVPLIAVARQLFPPIHEEVQNYFGEFGIKLRVVADAFAPPEAVAMAEHRIGVCLVGNSEIARPGVVGRSLTPSTLIRRSGLYIRKDYHDPNIHAFIDLALDESKNLNSRRRS